MKIENRAEKIIIAFILDLKNEHLAFKHREITLSKIFRLLKKEYFVNKEHQQIFGICRELYSCSVSINEFNIKNKLVKSFNEYDDKKAFSLIYKFDNIDYVCNKNFLDMTIEEIVKCGQSNIIKKSIKDLNIDLSKFDIDKVYKKMQEIMDNWDGERNNLLVPINQVVNENIERINFLSKQNSDITGVSSGFEKLDKLTKGFQPGNLIILAARTGMGKTAFSLAIAKNICEKYMSDEINTVVFFSLEMTKNEIINRLLSSHSKINYSKIITGNLTADEKIKVKISGIEISKYSFYINEIVNITPTNLNLMVKDIARNKNIKAIIVDYLQLMNNNLNQKSREQEVSQISRSLKLLARELNLPIIALSQLSRKPENRIDKRPILSDLRESGSIEQDADIILFLYSDDYYKSLSMSSDNKKNLIKEYNDVELIVAKHRNGPTRNLKLKFLKKYVSFID